MLKISFVDQFVMAYGGIRGAVCYGLVMSLDTDVVPCRNMLTTTVIVVVLFTVFVQERPEGFLGTLLLQVLGRHNQVLREVAARCHSGGPPEEHVRFDHG